MLSIVDEKARDEYNRTARPHVPQPSKFLVVRARVMGDIERVFGKAVKVRHTPESDYHYRARIDREAVAQVIAANIARIDYGNFKATVKDEERHLAYSRVWGSMLNLQYKRTPAMQKRRAAQKKLFPAASGL